MNVIKNPDLLFLIFILLIQVSCVESKKATSSPVTQQTVQSEGDKLLFVNLLFLKTAEGKDSCDLINSIVADGTVRGEELHQARNKENYYTLFLNSCDGKTVYKEEMDNQLDTQMEVYNENGTIELKNTSFKQREYSIKMQKGKEKICRLIILKTAQGRTETICNHLINL